MEIIGSLIIAILQSILFYEKNIGVSMLIFILIGTAVIWTILFKRKKVINKNALIIMIPIILLSISYLIFAHKIFYDTNIIAIIILTLLMFKIAVSTKGTMRKYIINSLDLIGDTFNQIGTSIKFTKRSKREKIKKNSKFDKNIVKKVVSSFIIVFIVVGIVILLLASADSIFAELFSGVKDLLQSINMVNAYRLCGRLLIMIIAYFGVLSFILALQKKYKPSNKEIKEIKNKDKYTIKMLLGALNIVYLVFCYIQITSLFAKVNLAGTFNYAQYARSGFFQLMFVSFINFAIILISNRNNEKRDTFIKIMNSLLIIFTVIIVLSSMFRMHMYETAYGLTYLRVFVYIILATELITFIPTFIYVYNSKFDLLKWGGIIATCVYVTINFANLENIIITRNISRTGSNVDYKYISWIATSDSYDTLTKISDKLIEEDMPDFYEDITAILQARIRILNNVSDNNSWQEFNISRHNVSKQYEDIHKEIYDLSNTITKFESSTRDRLPGTNLIVNNFNYLFDEMVSENEGYKVYEIDHVPGMALWQISKTNNGGKSYENINQMELTTSSKIEFFENGLGFLMIPDTIYGAKADLYITTDSGKNFEKIDFPIGSFTLSDSQGEEWSNCYDYFTLPKKESDGSLIVLASGGYEGGYNGGKTRAKYISIDNGRTWSFVDEVWK